MAVVTSGGLDRLERFLDDLDDVKDPNAVEEPFRTLWFRIHGQDIGTVSRGEGHPTPEDHPGTGPRGMDASQTNIEVSPASKEDIKGVDDGTRKGRIEIISPKEVGPTIEMKIEEKKRITFKAAVGDDLKVAKSKEEAARKLMDVQNLALPLKGMGGDAGKLYHLIREVAMFYRDGEYGRVNELALEINNRSADSKFRRSVFIYLKGKIDEYEKVGGDLTQAKERYKELATSLKEQGEDFITLVGSCNALVEESVKDILSESVVVEVVSAKPLPGKPDEKTAAPGGPADRPKVAPSPRKVIKKTIQKVKPDQQPPAPVRKEEREPEEEFEIEVPVKKAEPPAAEQPKEEATKEAPPQEVSEPVKEKKPLPIIKTQVVRKKLVQLVPKKVPASEALKPEEVPDEPIPEAPVPQQKILAEKPDPEPEAERKEGPEQPSEPTPDVQPQPGPVEVETPEPEPRKEPEGTPSEKIEEAFKKIQFVYNAAMKMHNGGRDVSQIFDMLNYADKVRTDGNMDTYVGVAAQCEAMIIQLQSK